LDHDDVTWDSSKGDNYGEHRDYEKEKKKMRLEVKMKSKRIWKNSQ